MVQEGTESLPVPVLAKVCACWGADRRNHREKEVSRHLRGAATPQKVDD